MRALLIVSLAGFLPVLPVGAQGAPTAYDSIFDQLKALPAGTGVRVATVSNLLVSRDAARFTLESGRLYLLGPVAGRTVAAVFVGTGRFAFTAPLPVERAQLKRKFKSEDLARSFRSLFLLFTDTADVELERGAQFTIASLDGPAASAVREGIEYFTHKGHRYVEPHVIDPLLNATPNGLFAAVVREADDGPFVYVLDPLAVEEVSLSVARSGEAITDRGMTLVSQFRWARPDPDVRPKDRFTVSRYVIESFVAPNLDFKARASVTLDWWVTPTAWFPLMLPHQLTVDSVRWDGGSPAVISRPKTNPMLWIRRPEGVVGSWPALVVHYHGDLLVAAGPFINLQASSGWYPQPDRGLGFGGASTFDLTFHTPKKYQLVSVGDRVDSTLAGDVLTTRWVTTQPVVHASFSIGRFVVYTVRSTQLANARVVPVTVYLGADAHAWRPGRTPATQREAVGEDAALSLNFFRDAFGEPPVSRFSVAEIAGWHGQAFPGLIHLSWMTYGATSSGAAAGTDEAFRSHEVAHQWWGLGVTPRGSRDAWLSEGLAEFSSWWYTEMILGDTAAVGRMLRRSREALLARRGKAGPISLGTRLALSDFPGDYPLQVYHKGAWTVRMLRYFLIDPDSAGDAPFRAMMRDFFNEFSGGPASTDDFRRITAKHARVPMDWFFDQWVDGTSIPTYQWRHTTLTEDGKLVWKVAVDQSDVPDTFRMPVPVRLLFPGGEEAVLHVLVSGPRTEFSIEVPSKPVQAEFNAWTSVLADVKERAWR